jgi:uncharacterized protein (TIGR02391 family)
MSEPDLNWVKHQLASFITKAKPRNLSGANVITARMGPSASLTEILTDLEVIEPILDRFYPDWRKTMSENKNYRFNQQYEGAQRCLARLERSTEVATKLGSTAPRLSADELHPWVWEAARPQWDTGHHAEAVRAAASSLNSRLQQRIGRRDISDKALVEQSFTREAAKPTAPRLRVMQPDESETYRSLQDGVRSFGVGCFQAIRNPLSHLPPDHEQLDLSRQEALERLAALSLLARWIENADLEEEGPPGGATLRDRQASPR